MPANHQSPDRVLRPGLLDEQDKPERFWKWFKENEPKVTVFIVVLSTLFHIEEIVRGTLESFDAPWFPDLCYVAHLVVIVLLFFYVLRLEQPTSGVYHEATKASRKFLKCLYALLGGWAMLYSALAIYSGKSLEDKNNLIAQACQVSRSPKSTLGGAQPGLQAVKKPEALLLGDALSLTNALQLAERYKGRCPKPGQISRLEDSLNNFRKAEKAAAPGAWEYPLVFLNILGSIPLFLLFWIMAPPGDESKRIAALLMVVLIVLFASVRLDIKLPEVGALEYLSSLFGGLALALWAARLSSVYLQMSTPTVTCLLLYAVLQLSGATFKQESNSFLIASEAMMLLKVFTVFVCAWLIDTRRLLYYFAELRQLHGLDTEIPIVGVSIDERFRYFRTKVDAEGQASAITLTQDPRPSTEFAESHNPAEPQVSIALIKVPASALKTFLGRLGFGDLMPRAVNEPTSSPAEPKVVTGSATTVPPTSAGYAESKQHNLGEG